MRIVDKLNQLKNTQADKSDLGWLFALEAKRTIAEIEKFIPIQNASQIQDFLAKRWKRIQGTDLAYVHAIHHKTTALCLDLAKQFAPILEKSTLELLMSTIDITQKNPVTLWSLADYDLQQILLRNGDTQFIDIATAIEHPDAANLNPEENERLINHSTETQNYHDAEQELLQISDNGSIGSTIEICLINRLKNSGLNGQRDGSDQVAGLDSVLGRINFESFLKTLTRREIRILFSCKLSATDNVYFGHLWDRLIHRKYDPKKTNDSANTTTLDSIYCVEQIIPDLRTLLKNNRHLYNIKSSNKKTFIEKLDANKKIAQSHLIQKLSQADFCVASTYGDAGRQKLLAQVLTEETLAMLTKEDLNTVSQQLRSFNNDRLFQQFERTPAANRFVFIRLLGLDHLEKSLCENGYQLAKILKMLPHPDQKKLLSALSQQIIQKIIQDKYQLADVISALSVTSAHQLIQSLGTSFIQASFSANCALRLLFAKKLDLSQWEKAAGLLQSDCLLNQVQKILTEEMDQLPNGSHWKFIELVGIKRALSLLQNPNQFKKFLSFFTDDQQTSLLAAIDFRKLFITNLTKPYTPLKLKIEATLNHVDDFQILPATYQKLVTDTLAFYCEERTHKASCFPFFKSKTKAADALQKVVTNKADKSTLDRYKGQFEKNNDLGGIYRRMKF